jgi:hypothetical protein
MFAVARKNVGGTVCAMGARGIRLNTLRAQFVDLRLPYLLLLIQI